MWQKSRKDRKNERKVNNVGERECEKTKKSKKNR